MTKRSASLHFPEGTTFVGTARVREDRRVGRSFAERELMRRTGNQPSSEFDDIADGIGPTAIASSIARSALASAQIGKPAPLSKPIAILTKPGKPAKYRNVRCEHDGIKFDSLRERDRWIHLSRCQAAGEICELERQVVFVLADPVVINGKKRPALRYIADFVYERNGETVIEDVKGRVTEGYRIKRHLMAARGLQIVEIK
ncbi:DUF1064 domain-containing protein [Burkholderia sp. PU8-34]